MTRNEVRDVQLALDFLGYNPGPIDGIYGVKTRDAVRRYQTFNKITIDGIVGPETLGKLARSVKNKQQRLAREKEQVPVIELPRTDTPLIPWYNEAERFKGLREGAGKTNNPVIMGWADDQGGWIDSFYTGDDIPWCGLFVAHCITSTLSEEPIPANPLGALQWNKFGVEVKPTRGAILTFTRPGGGHVGFYYGEDDQTYHVLGGNQSDSVNIMRIAKSRFVSSRWPSTVPLPKEITYLVAANGKISTNEA